VPGLAHGVLIAAFGWLLLWMARDQFWLLAGAFSGFLIVAPILATGLYHVSRSGAGGAQRGYGRGGRPVAFGRRPTGAFRFAAGPGGHGLGADVGRTDHADVSGAHRQAVDFLRHVVLVREVGLFEVWLLMGACSLHRCLRPA
jgi:hypothetical protein